MSFVTGISKPLTKEQADKLRKSILKERELWANVGVTGSAKGVFKSRKVGEENNLIEILQGAFETTEAQGQFKPVSRTRIQKRAKR